MVDEHLGFCSFLIVFFFVVVFLVLHEAGNNLSTVNEVFIIY